MKSTVVTAVAPVVYAAGVRQGAIGRKPSQPPSPGIPHAPIATRKIVLTALTALIPLAVYFVIPTCFSIQASSKARSRMAS